jgi:raffinose/stachyose/melibiose transport system permease protein
MPSQVQRFRGRSRVPATAIFLIPALALYALFTLGPLLAVFSFSLFDWNGIAVRGFAALDNYAALATQPTLSREVLNAFVNNWYFFLGTMAVQNTVSLGLALLLHRQRLAKRFFQTVIAIPFLVNPRVVGYAWVLLLNPNFGPVAQIMAAVGAEDAIRPWLGDPIWARPMVILINAWQWVGFPMLIFLAALGSIPEDLFQAARLDRAGRIGTFWHITLPLILPAAGTVALLTFIGCFNAFSLQFAVGGLNGSPAGVNDVLGLVFYRLAFGDGLNAIGVSSALATSMFLFVFVMALFMRCGLNRLEEHVS